MNIEPTKRPATPQEYLDAIVRAYYACPSQDEAVVGGLLEDVAERYGLDAGATMARLEGEPLMSIDAWED